MQWKRNGLLTRQDWYALTSPLPTRPVTGGDTYRDCGEEPHDSIPDITAWETHHDFLFPADPPFRTPHDRDASDLVVLVLRPRLNRRTHSERSLGILLAPQYSLAKNLGFEGGTTAKIDDTWGFGLQLNDNFNNPVILGGLLSWNRPDYHASVQPAPGNPAPATRSISGTLETTTFGMVLTYNILAGPLTPYLDATLAGTYVNTDIVSGPLRAASGILGTATSAGQHCRQNTIRFSPTASGEACDGTSITYSCSAQASGNSSSTCRTQAPRVSLPSNWISGLSSDARSTQTVVTGYFSR